MNISRTAEHLELQNKALQNTISECAKITNSVICENNILQHSLESCENALREKEVIITYLETRWNQDEQS